MNETKAKKRKAKKRKAKKRKTKLLVEIARSFSFKLNCGNYETADFFCSQKAGVPLKEAEKTSEALYNFCRSEVIKSVNKYLAENRPAAKKTKPNSYVEALKEGPNSQAKQEKAEEVGGELKQNEDFVRETEETINATFEPPII